LYPHAKPGKSVEQREGAPPRYLFITGESNWLVGKRGCGKR
jgi:hypothetical protein